jgi:hypothetical protein
VADTAERRQRKSQGELFANSMTRRHKTKGGKWRQRVAIERIIKRRMEDERK